MRWALPFFAMLLSVAPAAARLPTADPQVACEAAIATAQDAAQLPPGLLPSIALVESGRPDPRTGAVRPWPWTINVAGLGFFFPTKAAAVTAVQALRDLGIQSIDVGCLQVNLMYHPAAFASLDQAFDPWANARYAARFLDELYERTRSWTQAAGDYHSQTPALGAAYRNLVLARWRPFAASAELRAYGDFAPKQAVYADFQQNAYADFAPSRPHRANKSHVLPREAVHAALRQNVAYGDFAPPQPYRASRR